MICTVCNNDGIQNTANGKDFWYCRTCKTEIFAVEIKKMSEDDLLKEIEEALKDINYSTPISIDFFTTGGGTYDNLADLDDLLTDYDPPPADGAD